MDDDHARRAATETLRALASWAATTGDDAVPDAVLQRAVWVLADNLAAAVAARDEPEVRRAQDGALTIASAPQATVFRGGRARTDRLSVAVANAIAMVWAELEEGYRKTACHAGLYVIPALLAEAEHRGASVGAVLRNLALAYEIIARLARTWAFPDLADHGRGWVHARYAAPGAAAAAALCRGFDPDLTAAAIAAATTFVTAVPRRHHVEGVLAWNATPAVGTWSGMMAAEWAVCGITAPPTATYDVYATELRGVIQATDGAASLGSEWAILDGYTKLYGCIQHAHAAIEAALALRSRLLALGSMEQIAAIQIATHPVARVLDVMHPATTLAARFSLPHIVGATLAYGHAGTEAFSGAALVAPDVMRLRACCVVGDFGPIPPPPNDRPARVLVTLRDGRTVGETCLSARGGPDRPLSSDMISEKIVGLTRGVYPAFAAAFAELAAAPGLWWARPWAEFVTECCSSSDPAVRPES